MSSLAERARPAADLPMRPWTRAEFDRAHELGLFGPDERLELISGWIVPQEPMNRRHALAILKGFPFLERAFSAGVHVQQQLPVALSTDGEPLPDFAVIRGTPALYSEHPNESDVLLVIEISDSTLSFDRVHKLALYAEAGIPEYWIINLVERVLEVHTQPQAASYAQRQIIPETGHVTHALSSGPIAIADLLP